MGHRNVLKKVMLHNTENTLKNAELLHFKYKMDKHKRLIMPMNCVSIKFYEKCLRKLIVLFKNATFLHL